MASVVVDVMLKPELLDPQGQAIGKALERLGYSGVTSVRQGKRFELQLDGVDEAAAVDQVRSIADTLLANPVIEDFTVHPAP